MVAATLGFLVRVRVSGNPNPNPPNCTRFHRYPHSISLGPHRPTSPESPESHPSSPRITPFCLFFRSLRSFGVILTSRTRKLQSFLRGGLEDEDIVSLGGKGLVCSGGIGMLLMSTTAASTARVSPFVKALFANPTFVSGLMAWALAQSIKMLLNFFVERRWDLEMLFSCGGMPSSHSALCTALCTAVALCQGVGDSLFPVCLGFSLIVMYDAIGVRWQAGMQAEVLNKIVEDLFQGHPISQKKLKELLGHTPSQVFAGALLGIMVAYVCCQASVVAI